MTKNCFFCNEEDARICSKCEESFACSEHENLHHPPELSFCLPYSVGADPIKGNIMLASRDIEQGEIVLVDRAAAFGPDFFPVCLGCHTRIQETGSYSTCPKCFFPTCEDKECLEKNKIHRENEFSTLMTHHEDRVKKHPEILKGMEKITSFLRNDLGIKSISEEDVIRSFGVMKTNAIAFENGHGLYPVGSILSHSCVSNLEPVTEPMECLTLRAKIHIPKGAELSIRYMSFWNHRAVLRDKLKDEWFFECACERCMDPTEFETMLSCEKCPRCNPGNYMIPPMKLDEDWKCSNCSESRAKSDVLKSVIGFPDPESLSSLDEILKGVKESEKRFHPTHFVTMNYKYAYAKWISIKGSPSLLHTKMALKFYDSVLSITDKLDPGVTNDKGRILTEAAKLKLEILKKLRDENKVTQEVFDKQKEIIMALSFKGQKYMSTPKNVQ